MKAITIIKKIEKNGKTSIEQVELLTKALHREGRLAENKMVRFRPLYGDFDIVNSDLMVTKKFNLDLCEIIGGIEELKNRFFD